MLLNHNDFVVVDKNTICGVRTPSELNWLVKVDSILNLAAVFYTTRFNNTSYLFTKIVGGNLFAIFDPVVHFWLPMELFNNDYIMPKNGFMVNWFFDCGKNTTVIRRILLVDLSLPNPRRSLGKYIDHSFLATRSPNGVPRN